MAINHSKNVTIGDFTGTVTVFDQQGSTVTANASAMVLPSDWNSVHIQAQTLAGNTAGQSTVSGTNLIFVGGDNVTLSGSNGSIIFSASAGLTTAAQSNHSHGNPTLALTNLSGSTASNSSGFTLSLSAAPGGGAADGYNILAAGTQTANTTGTIVFANSNGLTFGMSGSSQITASYTVPAIPGATVFSNSNNVSFGLNGSTVTASATFAQSVQTQNSVQVLGSSGNISFANSNGITFGGNASTITASHNGLTTAAQSNHSHGVSLNLTNLAGTTGGNSNGISLSLSATAQSVQPGIQSFAVANSTYTTGQVSFSNANGISFGSSAGGAITASYTVPTVPGATVFSNSNNISFGLNGSTVTATATFAQSAQTQNLHNVTLSGNTAGVMAQVSSGTLTLAGGNNITLSQNGNAITISGANVGGAQTGISGLSAGTTQMTSGTAVFANSNGISFGVNGNTVTASYTVPNVPAQTVQTQNVVVPAAGTQTATSGTIVFANSNGISFGMSGSSQITASYTVPTVPGATVFSNSNNVSFGLNGSTVTATATFAQSVQTQNSVQVLGSSGNISFANGNGITFGGNASTITASHNGLTSQSNQAVSAANGSFTFQTLTFANSNGVSWSSGTQGLFATVQTNYLTTAAQSDHSHGNPTLALTNLSGTTASASNGFTLSLSAAAPGGGAGDGFNILAAGTQTAATTGTVVFANSNNITFGMSASSQITASFSQSVQPAVGQLNGSSGTLSFAVGSSLSASSNASTIIFGLASNITTALQSAGAYLTTAAQSNQVVNSVNGSTGQISFNVGSSLSASSNGSSITFGLASNITTALAPLAHSHNDSIFAVGNTTQSSSGTIAQSSLVFSGAGIASVGVSAGSVIVSVPSGGGAGDGFNAMQFTNSTADSTMPIVWAGNSNGSGNITMGLTGSTVTASAPSGGAGATLDKFVWPLPPVLSTQTQTGAAQSTNYIFPFLVREPFNCAFWRMLQSISLASTSFASTANTTFSYNQAETHRFMLYTRMTGASSQSLASVASFSFGRTWSVNAAYGSASNTSQFNTVGMTYQGSNNTSTYSTGFTTSNLSTMALSTGNATALTGVKFIEFPAATTLTAGEYWLAYNVSTTQTTQGTANLSNMNLKMSQIVVPQINTTLGSFGAASNSSIQIQKGIGSYTTAGGGFANTLNMSAISSSASHPFPTVSMINID